MLTMRNYVTATLLGLTSVSLSANTLTGTATLTADNHYGLYTGLSDASDLSLIGRNEKGYSGSPGTYNWSNPESWSVSLEAGQHLYVLAWDDGGPQSWIGQFNFGSTTLYSNAAQWEYLIAPGPNPGESGDLPDLSSVIAAIQNGSWSQVMFETPNGASPWGNIPGIDPAAKFIAADGFDASVASDAHFVIYRNREALSPIDAAPVPEAGTSAAGIALAVLAGAAARRRRKTVTQ
jgi:MYXO-CTERM domain-containing protein